jgi:hypothetical protein
MNLPDLYDGLRKDVKNFGVSRALYGLTFRAVNRAVDLKVLTCVVVREPDPEFAKHDPRFACSFLSADRLRALSSDPPNQLEPAFLEDALAKGDECFGILDGETLASYGWYSNRPTDIDGEVRLSFSARYVYMYKGFTRPSHRGQRLHAIGMTLALAAYRERGFDGLVSYVDSTNHSSLKSCYRMGYQPFGHVVLLRAFGRPRIYNDAGCRRYDLRVEAR